MPLIEIEIETKSPINIHEVKSDTSEKSPDAHRLPFGNLSKSWSLNLSIEFSYLSLSFFFNSDGSPMTIHSSGNNYSCYPCYPCYPCYSAFIWIMESLFPTDGPLWIRPLYFRTVSTQSQCCPAYRQLLLTFIFFTMSPYLFVENDMGEG